MGRQAVSVGSYEQKRESPWSAAGSQIHLLNKVVSNTRCIFLTPFPADKESGEFSEESTQ